MPKVSKHIIYHIIGEFDYKFTRLFVFHRHGRTHDSMRRDGL